MKTKIFEYTECPYCGDTINAGSPPSHESYEAAEIHIGNGVILLPDKLAINGGHTAHLEGYYCNPECLVSHIYTILKKEPVKHKIKPKSDNPLTPKDALKKWLKSGAKEVEVAEEPIIPPDYDELEAEDDEDIPF